MGEILSFSILSALVISILYIVYHFVKAPYNRSSFNRSVLLGIYAISLLSPLLTGFFALSTPDRDPAAAWNLHLEDIGTLPAAYVATPTNSSLSILLWIYVSGMAVISLFTIINLLRIFMIIHRGQYADKAGHRVIITDRKDMAPFSFGPFIVISEIDSGEDCRMIITHELSHIRLLHGFDLLISQAMCIFQWYNPVVWMMQRELKKIHEFQADHCVVNSGVNIREYQLLLIKKAVGTRFPSLANNLNHSKLKKRITMMSNQTRIPKGAWFRPLLLIPALGAAIWLINIPVMASAIRSISETALSATVPQVVHKVTKSLPNSVSSNEANEISEPVTQASSKEEPVITLEKVDPNTEETSKVYNAVDQTPEFPGGTKALMQFIADNVKSPTGNEPSGRVILRIVITKDGSIGEISILHSLSPALDAEAVRVVKKMPKWIPGKNNGVPVDSYFVLPVSFRSQSTTSESPVKVSGKKSSGLDSCEIYVDDKKFEGSLSDIPSDEVESMRIDKSESTPRIYITLKH
ncbi:MAG: TonB family protein [Muribaculaceae bacterium]|nr:TonB family protein [Muribaculaceae bacterium]